jgi:hypothetical protein
VANNFGHDTQPNLLGADAYCGLCRLAASGPKRLVDAAILFVSIQSLVSRSAPLACHTGKIKLGHYQKHSSFCYILLLLYPRFRFIAAFSAQSQWSSI